MAIVECGFQDDSQGLASRKLLVWGPTLLVDIGFDPALFSGGRLDPTLKTGAPSIPALIDTGAGESCIDDGLARQLGLPLVDRAKLSGAGGAHELNVYLGHIHSPQLMWTQWGRFAGVRLGEGGQPHRALIGRAFLATMLMVYDGRTGTTRLAR